jgi:aldose 1-epimerase
MKIEKLKWYGVDVVLLETTSYEAIIVPSMGANVIKLLHKKTGVNVLRTPKEDEVQNFLVRPHVYGLPVLFPPNRIEDGTYTYAGKKYTFPITMVADNHYHHGILKSQAFTVSHAQKNEESVELEAVFYSNRVNDTIFVNFPHEFMCKMRFVLSEEGLEHTISFTNLSTEPMPLGVGFHTTLAFPFTEDGQKSDYKLFLSAGQRWEQSERGLPTGKLLDLTSDESSLRKDGFNPTGKALEWHFVDKGLAVEEDEFHGTILTDTKKNISVFYEVDQEFKHWTLWTHDGNVDWLCPEPQTFCDNAPNMTLPSEKTGMQAVAAGETWNGVSKLYVKQGK